MVIIVLILVAVIAYKQYQNAKQRRQMQSLKRQIELQSANKVHIFSLDELTITKSPLLGSGQFGKVWKAYINESIIAVKELHDQNTHELSNFVKEFITMTQLANHPNILMVLGLVTENMNNGNLMICMQYCNEGSLKEVIERERDRFVDELTDIDKYAHMINGEVWDRMFSGKRRRGCKLATR